MLFVRFKQTRPLLDMKVKKKGILQRYWVAMVPLQQLVVLLELWWKSKKIFLMWIWLNWTLVLLLRLKLLFQSLSNKKQNPHKQRRHPLNHRQEPQNFTRNWITSSTAETSKWHLPLGGIWGIMPFCRVKLLLLDQKGTLPRETFWNTLKPIIFNKELQS